MRDRFYFFLGTRFFEPNFKEGIAFVGGDTGKSGRNIIWDNCGINDPINYPQMMLDMNSGMILLW
jgi:hypothetical protein